LEKTFSGCHGNGDGLANPEAINKLGKEAALPYLSEGKRIKYLAHLVILRFENRRPKQKHGSSPKVKHFFLPKILGWLSHCYRTVCCSNY